VKKIFKVEQMNSELIELSNVINLVLPESLGINEVKELQNYIITKGDYSEIIIESANLLLISSFGLQFLLSLNISAKNRNAKITIQNSSDYLIGVIKKLSLYDQLIKD
jgi:anti-anti-sigma regulatory factor